MEEVSDCCRIVRDTDGCGWSGNGWRVGADGRSGVDEEDCGAPACPPGCERAGGRI